MAVIAIHEDFASGGRKLGQLLSKRLGYHYVEKSLFQKMAEDMHVSENTLESFEQSREYRISNLFASLFSKSYIRRIVGFDRTVVEEAKYQESLRNLILGVAREDNVVIIGRAAHYFLKDAENCFRFRLVAPRQWREKYAVDELGIRPAQIGSVVEKRDRNEVWFLRSVCGEGFDDPLLFHLILNMSVVSLEQAVQLINSVVF